MSHKFSVTTGMIGLKYLGFDRYEYEVVQESFKGFKLQNGGLKGSSGACQNLPKLCPDKFSKTIGLIVLKFKV